MSSNSHGNSKLCKVGPKTKSEIPNRQSQVHITEFPTQLDFACLNIIFKDHLLCDVTLVAEGREIQAHKLILSIGSPFFYWKFSNDRHLGLLNRIEIPNISYETIYAIVGYLYKSEVLITEDNVEDLLAAAYLLALPDLQRICHNFLKSHLSPTNCIRSVNIAKQCQSEDLIAFVTDYVIKNFSEVITEEGYMEMNYEQITQIISSEELCAVEEDILECVIKWVKYDFQYRRDHIYTLMKNVRFSALSSNYIFQRLLEKWLTSDPHYNSFLLQVLKCHIAEIPHTISTKYRRSSKYLIAVGFTDAKVFEMEMYDFHKQTWLNQQEFLEMKYEACRTRVEIFGTKIYFVDGKSIKSVDITDPTPKLSECNELLENREWYTIRVVNNFIYSVGDEGVERFDMLSGVCTRVADMSESKSQVGLGVLNSNLYAVGGTKREPSNSRVRCSSFECYKPDSDTWYTMPSMSISRSKVGVAALGDNLYVVGGWTGQEACKQVELFNPAELSWKRLADMNVARYSPGVIAVYGLLYVVGGSDGKKKLKSVEVYDPKSNTWSLLPGQMNTGKGYVAVALLDKARIHL